MLHTGITKGQLLLHPGKSALTSLTWKTMWFVNTCLIQRTKYSVSASVSCTGSEDLNNGPKLLNSGMAASCSSQKGKRDDRHLAIGSFIPAWPAAILPTLQALETHWSSLIPWNISWREGATFSGLLVTRAISVKKKAKTRYCQLHCGGVLNAFISPLKNSLACSVSHILLQAITSLVPHTHPKIFFSARQCWIVRRDVWVMMKKSHFCPEQPEKKSWKKKGEKNHQTFS